MGEEEVERSRRRRGILVADVATGLLPSAYAAPTQPYNPPPANLPLANLQACTLANLHQAAYDYTHYHTLALRQSQDRPPDDLLGLKRLAGVCTALEEAGVGRGRGRAMLWLSEAETVAKLMLEGKNKLLEMMGLRAQRGQVALAGVERYTVVGWACSVHTCNGRGLNHSVGMGGVQWREVRQWWP